MGLLLVIITKFFDIWRSGRPVRAEVYTILELRCCHDHSNMSHGQALTAAVTLFVIRHCACTPTGESRNRKPYQPSSAVILS